MVTIEQVQPWENRYCESGGRKLCDEWLNEEVLHNARYAEAVVEISRREYEGERFHSSLGYRTPAEVARDSIFVAGVSKGEAAGLTS